MLRDLKIKTKEYKIFFLIIASIIICLFLVLIVSGLVGIINKIKQGRYIGADVAYKNSITVRGEGRVYTKPDIALVNLSVVTEGRNVKDVQEKNSEKMNKVIAFLKDFGISEKDIKTINYRIHPRYSYEDRRIPRIIGYEITQTLEVKIRDLETIGELLEQSVSAGINQVSSLHFEVDDDEKVKQEARKLAIEDAKAKARKLASQLGVKLIKISGFDEATSFDYPIFREFGIGGAAEVPQIQVGENEIVVNVTLIYEID
jgi:uncharacterized protein YggE